MDKKPLWQWLIMYSKCGIAEGTYASACGLVYADTIEQAKEYAHKNALESIAQYVSKIEDWRITTPNVWKVNKHNIETALNLQIDK